LRRLVACPENEYRRYLLCECVDAYLPLEEPQLREFERVLLTEPYKEILHMGTTWTERGEERGQRRLLQVQLEERFGPLAQQARERLAAWPVEKLQDLGRALMRAQSLRELGLED
jgi:hypothetical protein